MAIQYLRAQVYPVYNYIEKIACLTLSKLSLNSISEIVICKNILLFRWHAQPAQIPSNLISESLIFKNFLVLL